MPRLIAYPDRNAAIDALRGVSILLVLLTHLEMAGPFGAPVLLPAAWFQALAVNGGLGVSLFFVLSGYLITQTVLQRYGRLPAIDVREFYVLRASRILPTLLLLVGVNLVAMTLSLPGFELSPKFSLSTLLGHVFTFRFNLLYVQGAAQMKAWAPLWSLAVEEVFYLVFPVLALGLRRAWLLVPFFGAMVLTGYLYRDRHDWQSFYLYWGCFDQLALGCLTAVAASWSRRADWPRAALRGLQAAGLGVIATSYFAGDLHAGNWVWQPTALAIGASLFLFGSPSPTTHTPPSRTRRLVRILGLAGFLSYELYLFHAPVLLRLKAPLQACSQALGRPLPADLVYLGFAGVMVLLAGVMHTWFSDPVMRWLRQRLAPQIHRKNHTGVDKTLAACEKSAS